MSTALDTFKSFIETSFTELTKEQKEYDTYKTPEQGAKDEYQSFVNEMETFSPSSKPITKNEVNPINLSQEGLDFLANQEGFKEKAYKDNAGIWTVGFGSTTYKGKPVTEKTVITKQEALEEKKKYVEEVQSTLASNLKVPVTQNQYDALVSLGYNIGRTALAKSSIIAKLNAGKKIMKEDFLAFNKLTDSKTKKLVANLGLENRRNKEFELFIRSLSK